MRAGKRVAIAEQTSEPSPGKIVEREISQIVSAGTVDDPDLLEANAHNYLAAVFESGGCCGLAFLDHSTGEFSLTECPDLESLEDELSRARPSELLISEEQEEAFGNLRHALAADSYTFLPEHARPLLLEHFGVQSLDGFGCESMEAAVGAAGALLYYLQHQLRRGVDHIRRLRTYTAEQFVVIDRASQQNLDLVESRSGVQHTLLAALDRTSTPMGGRKLRHWILHPLRELGALVARQELIASLLEEPFLLEQLREDFAEVRDIERTLGRLSQGSGNPRDLLALSKSLSTIPNLKAHLAALHEGRRAQEEGAKPLAATLDSRLHDFGRLTEALAVALVDEPPAHFKEGGIFRDGYLETLDEIRAASREGKQWLADLQTREIERSGIKSLKVKYNAVFGYFIEITKANLAHVPENYQRKQTTANAERYFTPELKEVENKILGADERARNLEYEEFLNLREGVLEHLEEIQESASALATLDVLCSLAETARLFSYTRPRLNQSKNLFIEDGRHPVLDQSLVEEKFVPNDTTLDGKENRVLLITGPNMAGKSTYIRQVALLTLMAQIGSYLPAAGAEIGLVDRIFTRVGASDDLSRGQSTFMVEMNETALIVNNATDRSLVILDEIGRGTATFDGLSIAWSVTEYLHDVIGARALFATHYHELTALSKTRTGVQNYNIAVREWNERIIFLRKIVPGSADKSYGIQVARLAGLPVEIIERAREILSHLEANASRPDEERPILEPEEDLAPVAPKKKKKAA
ncbi:MAG: DNA mismatch repair protein MutS, partial [Verrucomicrobiales bacterium]